MPNYFTKLIATFFYIGELPFAPGSVATFLGMMVSIYLSPWIGLYVFVTGVVIILGFLSSRNIEQILKEKDPSRVVIDEVAGALIAFFQLPHNIPTLITAYFLFRAFDMFKTFPVNKFEDSAGSSSIMLDDLFAGLYTCMTMHAAIYLKNLWGG